MLMPYLLKSLIIAAVSAFVPECDTTAENAAFENEIGNTLWFSSCKYIHCLHLFADYNIARKLYIIITYTISSCTKDYLCPANEIHAYTRHRSRISIRGNTTYCFTFNRNRNVSRGCIIILIVKCSPLSNDQ